VENCLRTTAFITALNLQGALRRLGASAVAIIGIAGTVIVLCAVLSIAAGLRGAVTGQASDQMAIVLASGAPSEIASRQSQEAIAIIDAAAAPLASAAASAEVVVLMDQPLAGSGSLANLPVRGMTENGRTLRRQATLTQGRWFEAVVGRAANAQYQGLKIGDRIGAGASQWSVVGVFASNGDASESEVWMDASVLQAAYSRMGVWQSVRIPLKSRDGILELKNNLAADARVKSTVRSEKEFVQEQAGTASDVIERLGIIFAAIMGLASLFAAMQSMYTALAKRTQEICTLRALGFRPASVAVSVLVEGMVLGMIGGVIGALLAFLIFDGRQAYTLNTASLTTIAFDFAVTPAIIQRGLLWALSLGLVGALLPAIKSVRMPVALGLREA
jgi:putative ABC transport system permease protein